MNRKNLFSLLLLLLSVNSNSFLSRYFLSDIDSKQNITFLEEILTNKDTLLLIKNKINGLIINNYPFDDPRHLTVKNTHQDTLSLINDHLQKTYKDIIIKLKNKNDTKKTLKENMNKIHLKVILNDAETDLEVYIAKITMTDEQRLDRIKEKIDRLEIDGSKLTTTHTFNDALGFIKKEIKKIDKNVIVELFKEDNKKLVEGKNFIKIFIIANKLKITKTLTIVNVKCADENSINDIKNYILNEIKILTSKNLTVNNEINDALKLICKIVKEKYPSIFINLKDKKIGTQKLKEKGEFEIILTHKDKRETLLVKIINLKKSDLEVLNEVYKEISKYLIIDWGLLTTENTQRDVIKLIKEKINDLNANIEVLPTYKVYENKNLVVNYNYIYITLKLNAVVKYIIFTVKNVKLSDYENIEQIIKNIKWSKNIINNNLTSNLTIKNLKKQIENILIKLNLEKNVNINIYENHKVIDDNTKLLNFKDKDLTINIEYGKKNLNFEYKLDLIKLSNEDFFNEVFEALKKLDNSGMTKNTLVWQILPKLNEILSYLRKENIFAVELFGNSNDLYKNIILNQKIVFKITRNSEIRYFEWIVKNI